MKKSLLAIAFAFLLSVVNSFGQINKSAHIVVNNYAPSFAKAYQIHPGIPKGTLEAVSFCNTHFTHLQHVSSEQEGCNGIPNTYGPMGLTLNGQDYFNNNLVTVSKLSGYSIEEIISNPEKSILAYAEAYMAIKNSLKISSNVIADQLAILANLSELPKETKGQNFALNTQLFGYLQFLNNFNFQQLYGFPNYHIDFKTIFGATNYAVLSSTKVTVSDASVYNKGGQQFQAKSFQSSDYAPALWNAAATCNYGSRSGTAISAVTIHTVQGSYAGCISWFQNCAASVSAHYVVRSSDGQITQMVSEADNGWHVGSANLYTIGIEHEGFVNDASWYTNAMYTESAKLVCDITNSGYGINATDCWNGPPCTGGSSTCQLTASYTTKGHQHYPNQSHTDPGPNWDWPQYYNLVNNCGASQQPPTNLTVQQATCPGLGVWFDWQNSASGWLVDVTDDPNWGYFWNKDIANLTTIVCPGGFCLYNSTCTISDYLSFQPNTTYYWRIWNGSAHTYGQSFTTPYCGSVDNTNCSQTFNDSGGQNNSYSNNEDYVLTLSPPNAVNVTVNFTSFDLEDQSDFLYVHDGNSTNAPQIAGSPFTGTILPGTITSTGPSLTFHFTSDPFVYNAGWEANWTCNQLSTTVSTNFKEKSFNVSPNPFLQKIILSYELNQKTSVEVEIFDVIGKTIYHYTGIELKGKHQLIMEGNEQIENGIYFMRITTDEGTIIKKLIKQ